MSCMFLLWRSLASNVRIMYSEKERIFDHTLKLHNMVLTEPLVICWTLPSVTTVKLMNTSFSFIH